MGKIMYSQDMYQNNNMLMKLTPNIEKKIKDSNIPMVRISLEDLQNSVRIATPEEVKKIPFYNISKKTK